MTLSGLQHKAAQKAAEDALAEVSAEKARQFSPP